ncbi:hydrogenase [Candidatus Bipolaricaulota bacterium]|nr:hydrogenase [Candidatus Bipolaricaulota bacterium]
MRLFTGEGHWSPLVWLALAAGVGFFAWLLWRWGRRTYKAGTEQDIPFLSGERAPEGAHVGAPHLYWGFLQGLRPVLEGLRAFHSGFLGDYVTWMVVLLAVALLVVALT